MKGIIAKKLGMTQVYDDNGVLVPVTVLQAGPCTVMEVKTKEKNGYSAIQLGFGERKAKNAGKAMIGRAKKVGIEGNPPSAFNEIRDPDKDIKAGQMPGQGGPMVQERRLTVDELSARIDELTQQIEQRNDRLGVLESMLLQQRLSKSTIPSGSPVNVGYNSSSFGWRVDPFTGHMAMHEGLDFMAEIGTPIRAAAGGIVTQAENTPDYGNIVKVDHGAGLETRYAHAKRLLVKVGDRVQKGQLIAEVGNTGRSTGAHLHFEVRLNGVPLDPRKYLLHQNG